MRAKTVAFADSRAGGIESLIGSNSGEILWFTLNPEEDGLDQMQRILEDFSALDSIHILTHGSTGTLYLGNTVLNSDNLASYQAQLEAIGASLTSSGDILLYGCDVARGDAGLSFINWLAKSTGANVAASSDVTGAQGNWLLEEEIGVVESTPLVVGGYAGTLAVVNGTDGNDSLYGTAHDDVLNGGAGIDTVVYRGNQSSYEITPTSSGALQVSGPEGVDVLVSIESLTFGDANIQVTPYNRPAEFQVNTYTKSYQSLTSITGLSDGGWVVTWQSNEQDGSGNGVYGQRYTAAGIAIGDEFRVNTYSQSGQGEPSVTALADGGWMVTWMSYYQVIGDLGDIYGQRYTPDGLATGGEFRVNTYINSWQSSPAAAALPDGGWVVTWMSGGQDGSGSGVYGQRYASNGAAIGGEFRVNTYTDSTQSSPSVTALADGGWVVTWVSGGQDGSGSGVYGQRYTSAGIAIGDEFRVNTHTDSSQRYPSVAALSDGGWVVTWESDEQDGSNLGIYGQRYNSVGATIGDEFRVNTHTDDAQWSPSVAALSDGGWVVTWHSYGPDGSNLDIYGQRYTPAGNASGSEFRVNTYTDSPQSFPSVAALSDGGWVVTWDSYGQESPYDYIDGSGIYAQRYDADGVALTYGYDLSVVGDASNQTLTGGGYHDTLDGRAGADTLIGGGGDDIYIVDNVGDVITESWRQGTDTVRSSVTYTLVDELENLSLTGTATINGKGNALANILTGNDAANELEGRAGADILDGGLGADTLIGGTGDDTYIVDNMGDVVTELANEGTDTVHSSISYTLGVELENLTLTGYAAINGTGNDSANMLTGNDAANWLDGNTGADTLIGGAGDDTYIVDNQDDVITELVNEGTDTVRSSIAYTLGAELENLTLIGTEAIDGRGNSSANVLTGNSAANELVGGFGADTLIGGAGDDTYFVDNIGDVIIELVNEGIDTVHSSITYTLGVELENLTLTGYAAINGTGNDSANVLSGNSAANTLAGAGGDDIYIVNNYSDEVIELSDEGTDTVYSSVTYRLPSNVENVILTWNSDIGAVGNGLANELTGNRAANVIRGDGGDDSIDGGHGDDTLTGGAGNDALEGGSGHDTAVYTGIKEEYTITHNAGTFIITDLVENRDGIDNVTGVESIRFGALQTFPITSLVSNAKTSGGVTISGTAIQGEVLVAVNTLADTDGLGTLQYQWLADGSEISGATDATYTLTQAEVGKKISVQVSYVDGGGTTETVTSAQTSLVSDLILGGNDADDIQGTGPRDLVKGMGGDDILRGAATGKANLLEGGAGDDRLIGGDRTDKAVFEGKRSDYEIAYESGLFKVIDKRNGSPEGTDTLENLNLIQFADAVEFLPMAANRVALTGDETDNTVAVDESQLYNGTRLAEIFQVESEVSAMIMAGDGDTVVFHGSFADYDFAQLGSQLQVSKDGFVNTVNVGGDVQIETDEGSVLAELSLDRGMPVMMLGNQMVGDGFDVAALVVG